MTVNQILSKKGSAVCTILSTITVYDAIKVMGEQNIGAVLIVEDGRLKGILSERDYARKIVLRDKTSKETLVHEIMETQLTTVAPNDKIDHCMTLMSLHRVRHLPVLEGETVVGIISIGDVVQAIIEEQKETIEQMNSYITQ